MRLTKLKLAGFKSFVDPTVVLTPAQLVGIVGPNGCGKSNLIDAVRWVLGESRASALRGESMQDVIFGGSTTRKPVSRASVELVFDNADGRAAGQWSTYAEISVKRLVDRSGDSEYFINGVKVRRKDVIDLFLGTGLGPRAYAIIEQGMISRVIEARPEDVRAFLEEAAGITKYKERRRETEGRLADARDNLARVEDISAELGLQVDRLSAQAELALRYKELSSALSQRQVLLWRFKRTQAGQELNRLQAGVSELARNIDESSEQLRAIDGKLLLAREGQQLLAEAVQGAQADFFAISSEVSRIETEIKSLRETHLRLNRRGTELNAEENRWSEREQELADEQASWSQRRSAAIEELELIRAQSDEHETEVPTQEAAWQLLRTRLDELKKAQAQAEQQVRVEETRYQAGIRALDGLAQRRLRLEAERTALNPSDADALLRLEDEVSALSISLNEEEARGELLLEQAVQAQESASQARRDMDLRAGAVTRCLAQLDALRSLQAQVQENGDLSSWLSRMGLSTEAPLWRHLHVERGWELAVEAFLRDRIAAFGPISDERLVESLRQPVPKTVTLIRKQLELPATPHFTGRALSLLVQCDRDDLQVHLNYWLSGVFAVDTLDVWLLSGQALPPGVTLINKAGQILTSDTLSLYAPESGTHGALERQSEIERLEHELLGMEEASAHARECLAETEAQLADLQDATRESQARGKLLLARLSERKLDFVKAQQQAARHSERIEQLAREVSDLVAQETSERAHLADAGSRRSAAEESVAMISLQVEELQGSVAEQETALRQARDLQARIVRRCQDAEFAVRECEVKLGDIERNLRLVSEQREKSIAERAKLDLELDGLDAQSVQLSLQTALDLRHQREAALALRRADQEAAQHQLRLHEEARMALELALAPMREKINELRLQSQAAEWARQQATERLGELGAEIIELEPEAMADIKETGLSRDVARLTREINELGPVNLAALVELEAARERKRYLDIQYADLSGAIETLENAIRRIDRETREQLKSTYETVNRHFSELFPRLFGGGQAQLVLTGDEILDAGVQIIAQPPGKKNTSIHLLSGGEKALTAIALVFAMFQLNPAPFCMLDEVDAPLDDANTERYCEMVKHMSSVTQFVFISHSKITMEMAKQLVGVTMQEQGVSRVVEVDMEEALKLAQPVAA